MVVFITLADFDVLYVSNNRWVLDDVCVDDYLVFTIIMRRSDRRPMWSVIR